MQEAIVIHRPDTPPLQLLLLFHGVGARAEDMLPLGQALAQAMPQACVISVRSPHAGDMGGGWQWFSVRGVDEANRPARVAAAMPSFVDAVQHWQRDTGVGAEATTLVGFSQGAIMALESTQQPVPLASRVVSLAGRFAQAPRVATPHTRVHLLHGEQDGVMPLRLAVQAHDQLTALGTDTTLDLFPGLGHGLDNRVVRRLLQHLQT